MEIFPLSGPVGAWPAVQRMKLQLDRLRRLSLPEKATTRARRVLEQAPHPQHKHPNYFTA